MQSKSAFQRYPIVFPVLVSLADLPMKQTSPLLSRLTSSAGESKHERSEERGGEWVLSFFHRKQSLLPAVGRADSVPVADDTAVNEFFNLVEEVAFVGEGEESCRRQRVSLPLSRGSALLTQMRSDERETKLRQAALAKLLDVVAVGESAAARPM